MKGDHGSRNAANEEALKEFERIGFIQVLAILRDQFSGKGTKAAIISIERCNAATRYRTAQLGIAVIDLEELKIWPVGTAIENHHESLILNVKNGILDI